MDIEGVNEAVSELARILRADGADLLLVSADAARDRIELQLKVEGASCQECILGPTELNEVILDSLRRRVPTEFELVLHDPRVGTR